MHNGSVSVFSDGPNKGSTFKVTLPRLQLPLTHERNGGTVEPLPGEARRILIIDDNRDAADSMGMVIKLLGHQVLVAYDGAAIL
jgi:hypothetical protein